MKITFNELEDRGFDSVTDYCRELMKDPGPWLGDKIEVYRGEMLCLTVTDIPAAARLEPRSTGGFKLYKRSRTRL